MKRRLWIGLGIVLVALVGYGLGQAAEPRGARVGLGVGYQPPSFSAEDLKGNTHNLASYKGRILVLHFWATWCPYCRGEIPELTELHNTWSSKGVRVVTISSDEDLEALKTFVAQQRLPYPVIADVEADESIAEQYGVSGIPVTYIVGKDGRIVARLGGASEIIEAVSHALGS